MYGPRTRRAVPVAIVMALLMSTLAVLVVAPAAALGEGDYGDPVFQRTWERTDKPVEDGSAERTWIWGGVVTGGTQEAYAQSPSGQRTVQYFDKARMEISHPDAIDDGLWYVSNGLLVNELISGRLQVGDAQFEQRSPAEINVAGDDDDPDAVQYADLAGVLGEAATPVGTMLDQVIDAEGHISTDPSLARADVTAAQRVSVPGIDHTVASPFWALMNQAGSVWVGGSLVNDRLFVNPYYATGYPTTEAYWTHVNVGGVDQLVLLQCFERRCLTYTMGNPAGWQVEFGNVGRHYHEWRYGPSAPSAHFIVAYLNGANERPQPIDTAATGWAAFCVSSDQSSIEYQLWVSDIENATASHIHTGSADETGGILIPLFAAGDTPFSGSGALASGTITAESLPDGMSMADLIADMVSGQTYVNVHTQAHGPGEIRGQTASAGNMAFSATMSPDGEVPPVEGSDADGTADFFYDATAGTISYQITVSNLEGITASHIHLGAADATGGVVVPLQTPVNNATVTGSISAGNISGALAGASVAELACRMAMGDTYVNVHTGDHPSGEIRGQIAANAPGTDIQWGAFLDGSSEAEPVTTDAMGFALFTWHDDDMISYYLFAAGLSNVTAAHIHMGAPGTAGDIVVPLFAAQSGPLARVNGLLAEGTFGPDDLVGPLAGKSLADLIAAGVSHQLYVNVHTSAHPGGEIRGQTEIRQPDIGAIYAAELSGAGEVPPNDSDAQGAAIFLAAADHSRIDYVLVAGPIADATASHIHLGAEGVNGDVVVPLWAAEGGTPASVDGVVTFNSFSADDLTGPLEGATIADLEAHFRAGDAYVNIHSSTHPPGELRGQVELLD